MSYHSQSVCSQLCNIGSVLLDGFYFCGSLELVEVLRTPPKVDSNLLLYFITFRLAAAPWSNQEQSRSLAQVEPEDPTLLNDRLVHVREGSPNLPGLM